VHNPNNRILKVRGLPNKMQTVDIPPVAPIKPLRRKQLLYQLAQEAIKSYIIEHSLKPGDPLPPESDLAQQLGIGRNSVREAVKALEALGILEARAGAGIFVRTFSFDSIFDNLAYGLHFEIKRLADVLEVRYHIEYGMVPRVIESQTPAQLKHLHIVLTQMREVADRGRYSAELDETFHRLLYENIDNSVLLKVLHVFWAIYRQAQNMVSMPEPADPIDTYQRHADLVQALEARDIGAMQTAMARHRKGVDTRVRMLEQAQRQEVEAGRNGSLGGAVIDDNSPTHLSKVTPSGQ
jgi:DNA-binding FadR family transcriptional regulator